MNWRTVGENTIYTYQNANNGSTPMWASGNTCLVTSGERVFASGVELVPGAKPLNNVRWTLWECVAGRWVLRQRDLYDRTREPSPLCVTSDGRLWMSVNPTTQPNQTAGRAQPQILEWHADDTQTRPRVHLPVWDGSPAFGEHSYRTFVADGPRGELFLAQNIEMGHAEWTFRDCDDQWSAQGKLVWPWGSDYEIAQPIRICYPSVQLKNRQVHFCGVSDIEEPVAEWKRYKYELTGQKLDYDFRRLWYCWSKDILSRTFEPWIEIASCEATAGRIYPCDLHVAYDDRAWVHLLWIEKAIDVRLRDKFFPDARQSWSLKYAILDQGGVVYRKTLRRYDEIDGQDQVGEIRYARFHVARNGGLSVIYHDCPYVPGFRTYFNRVMDLANGNIQTLAVTSPLMTFYMPTERAGCERADTIHMIGEPRENPLAIKHVQVEMGT